MKNEIGLFVIWENALYKKDKILCDISQCFKIMNIFHIEWEKDKIIENYNRYYGKMLQSFSLKEKGYQNGKFLLIIVQSDNQYAYRNTSHGVDYVNIRMFDSKMKYRSWTGGGHKIHGSNSLMEANHDLTLLLGLNVEEYLENYHETENTHIINLKRNVFPVSNLKSEEDLFNLMNNCIIYANFPYVDKNIRLILIKNPEEFALLLKEQFEIRNQVIYVKTLSLKFICISPQDEIICSKWYKDLFKRRIFSNGRYWISEEDNKYLELYFYLILNKHRGSLFYKYYNTDKEIIRIEIEHFIKKNNYAYKIPGNPYCFFKTDKGPVVTELQLKRKDIKKILILLKRIFRKFYRLLCCKVIDYSCKAYYIMCHFLFKNKLKIYCNNEYKIELVKLIKKFGQRLGTRFYIFKGEGQEFILKGFDLDKTYKTEKMVYREIVKNNKILKHHYFEVLNLNNYTEKFILMPFYKGKKLSDIMNNRILEEEELNNLYEFAIQVLDELGSLNTVHRDIRPENIFCLLDEQEYIKEYKLYDFAYASSTESDAETIYFRMRIADNLGGEWRASDYFWDDAVSFYLILLSCYKSAGRTPKDKFKKINQYCLNKENRRYRKL